jgi:hypothetical protein
MAKKELNAVFESGSMGVASANVDETGHVIKHAKILGKTSINNRDYGPAINPKALTAYEGAPVFAGHVGKPGQSRNGSYGDRIGTIRSPSIEADGLYGNIHYNPEHPLAKSLVWEAKNEPKNLGLSHHADLAYRDRNQSIVESIEHVHSVDLVNRPATTNGLFESENPVKTFKQVLESLPADNTFKAVFEEMMAGDSAMAAMPVDAPVGGQADDQIKAAFRSAVTAAFDDDSLDSKATLAKIKSILGAYDKLNDKGEKKEPPAVEKTDAKTESVDEKLARLTRLERENEARRLAVTENVKLEDIDIKAVCALMSADDRAAFVKRLPKVAVESKGSPPPKPAKSGSAATFESAEEPQTFKSNEDRLAFLRG